MNLSNTPAPCPFCLSAETDLVRAPAGWRVECDECGAAGPAFKAEEDAVFAWNLPEGQHVH